jgi:hypothetical protein
MTRLKQGFRRLWDYIRYDLREIINPSSLPNPPGYVPPPRTPIKVWFKVSSAPAQYATRSRPQASPQLLPKPS